MAKEEQNPPGEEVPWCLNRPHAFATPWPYDEDRIQEANRALEAYEETSQRD